MERNLDELYELPEGIVDDNEDFNRKLESANIVEENVEEKNNYVREISEKECDSLRGLKTHETLQHTRKCISKIAEKLKKTDLPTLKIRQFEEIVKDCATLCHGDFCLSEET